MLDLGHFPAVVGGDMKIQGELYQVDSETLASLDRLEGHPSFYERRRICVVVPDPRGGEAEGGAWCYFLSSQYVEKMRQNRAVFPATIESGIWHGHSA